MRKRPTKIKFAYSSHLPELFSRLSDGAKLARWLGVRTCDLDWLCNPIRSDQLLNENASRHYVCRWVRKRSTGWRLIESPKPMLKECQRKILAEILNHVPAHPLACGFCKSKSIVDFVKPYVQRSVCLKMDLADFFPTITVGRVVGLFRAIGFKRAIAHQLALLSTTHTDSCLLGEGPITQPARRESQIAILHKRHLAQGAPTSPVIANLCAYRLDLRLSGLARKIGSVHYTRYADDLLFSGNQRFGRQAKRLQVLVGQIAIEEGFQINFRKTRIMHAHDRQKAGGVVLNSRLNLDRRDFDRLKATLNNCVRHGVESQNRDGHPNFRQHLQGKINWVRTLNPGKADRLEKLFQQIKF